MQLEGGFQGRTNKLVDACYSFWQAATFPLIQFRPEKGVRSYADAPQAPSTNSLKDWNEKGKVMEAHDEEDDPLTYFPTQVKI